jgi:hypothetical protein
MNQIYCGLDDEGLEIPFNDCIILWSNKLFPIIVYILAHLFVSVLVLFFVVYSLRCLWKIIICTWKIVKCCFVNIFCFNDSDDSDDSKNINKSSNKKYIDLDKTKDDGFLV